MLEAEFGNPPAPMISLDGYLRCPHCVDIGLRTNYVSYMQPAEDGPLRTVFRYVAGQNELDKLLEDKKQLDQVQVNGGMKAMLAGMMARLKK